MLMTFHCTHDPHLARVPPVDDLNPLLAREAVDVDLVGVPAAVPLLLGSPVWELEGHLHLHLAHPLRSGHTHTHSVSLHSPVLNRPGICLWLYECRHYSPK